MQITFESTSNSAERALRNTNKSYHIGNPLFLGGVGWGGGFGAEGIEG